MNWFYSKDGQQMGPVAFSEIERLLAEGQLTEESLVWQQGTPNWIKLSKVLSASAPAPEPPVSAPPIPTTIPAGIPAATVEPAAPRPATPVPVVAGKFSGFAITSLILSIFGLFCCSPLFIGGLTGVIFGHLALGQIRKDPTRRGRGLAIAGLIIGYISIILGVAFIFLHGAEFVVTFQEAMRQAQEQQQLQNSNP